MREPIYIILTTYKRTLEALKTVEAFKKFALYEEGQFKWIISDDGSGDEHITKIVSKINEDSHPLHSLVYVYNSNRKGVGDGMNHCLKWVKEQGGKLVITLEDDWVLYRQYNFSPLADLLVTHNDVGMIRLGYVSPGISANLISLSNLLWWDVLANGYTYRYTGHPALKHVRLYDYYGYYKEGLPPGQTELYMCGNVNSKAGPKILIPVYFDTQWGIFHHIGSQSLADMEPG